MTTLRARLHADGGARGNPGPAGIGVILRDPDGRVIGEIARPLGVCTNNEAEYQALIAGLELALEAGVTDLEIFMDSQLVVSQVKGEWKIRKEHLRALAVRARALLGRFPKATLAHVERGGNEDADKLANQAMDAAALEGSPSNGQGSLLE